MEVNRIMAEKIKINCPLCRGKGVKECSNCNGKGYIEDGSDCPACKAVGYFQCTKCEGTGLYETYR